MPESAPDLLSRAEEVSRLAVADPTAAAPVAANLVDQAREARSVEALVVALRAQAWSDRTHLAGEHAKSLLDEAAQLARREGLDARLGEVLVMRSAVQQELGNMRSAQRDLDAARPLLGGAALAELEHQTAVIHHNAGRLREAARIYRRVLANPDAPIAIRAKDSNNLGLIEADLGRYDSALALLNEARRLAEDVGPALAAYFTEGQAAVLARAGMLPASLEMFDLAERLYERAGLPRAELYTEFADAMADLRLFPEATIAARKGRDEFDANRVPLMRAEADLRVARLALLSGDAEGAESSASRAAEDFRRQGRTGWAAMADVVVVEARVLAASATYLDLRRARRAAGTLERLEMSATAVDGHLAAARVALALGRTRLAEDSFAHARMLARRGSVLTRLRGHLAAAMSATARNSSADALRECRSGLRDLEEHRTVLASTELRVLASAHGVEFGRIGLRTLVADGSAADVLSWLERTRAAALLAVQPVALSGLEEDLAELHALQTLMRSGRSTADDLSLQTALEDKIRRAAWAASGTCGSPDRPPSLASLRQRLGDRALVEYGILDGHILAAVLTSSKVNLVHLGPRGAVEEELEKLLFALRMLARSSTVTDHGMIAVARRRIDRLRTLLIDPLPLRPSQEAVVVAVGTLQRVPWSALHTAPIALTPSAAFWLRAGERSAPLGGRTVLVAGPHLVAADAEVSELASLHPDPRVLLPPDSTVAGVTAALADAGLVHFACHGTIRTDNPMFSGLALSDGLLTVQELDLQGVAPHRAVLAACEAAADVAFPGGEMLGFVSALMARGTAGLVASVVLVPDRAATSFMESLHAGLGRLPSALALHEARALLDGDDAAEFVNWCGFTAFGAA